MNDTKDKSSDNSKTVSEGLNSLFKEAGEILNDNFKAFADDLNNFSKNHAEKRKKLFDENRKPRRRAT